MAWRGAVACAMLLLAGASARADEPPLQALARAVGPGQGVYADAPDGSVLVAQAESRAVHPASVTKVATTLALLQRLGPSHRFETRVLATGPERDGRLDGDLVVEGGNDPCFVFESAFLVLERLRASGVRTVGGRMRVRGPFLFNWQPDPDGRRLARALSGSDGAAAWATLGDPQPLTQAGLRFRPTGATAAAGTDERDVLRLRSPPLLHVVKWLNGYSNNVFHYASASIGGPAAVETIARASVPDAFRDEITIENGAGGGTTNRLSPRVAVALLRALDRTLIATQHTVTDVLPVSGVDPGTLHERLLDRPRFVVGKTGTFGSVGASALAGLVRSRRYGTVAFAVLNHGVAVPEARKRQDAFVRDLLAAVDAEPWEYGEAARPIYAEAIVE